MRILHTGDWHLGKKLEGRSRIGEQALFLEELEQICIRENIDIIIIAGDIYDSPNPSVEAEKLYYESLKKLSNQGKRAVIIISGNHDSGDKLLSSDAFAREFGILIFGKPLEKKDCGFYGKFEVVEAYEGAILLKKGTEELFVNALPYPSERTLNEVWDRDAKESYSEKIGDILKKSHSYKKEGTKSVIVSHLFTLGAENEGSEREIELGGAMAFDLSKCPNCDYIALGHIHRPMEFKKYNCCYAGSPLEFRVSENKFDKAVFVKDLDTMELKKIPLKLHKEIKSYMCRSIEEALLKSEELMDKEEWIYLYIECDRPLKSSEIRKIKKNKNVLEIIPKIKRDEKEIYEVEDYSDKNIKEAFCAFYKREREIEPSTSTLEAFLSLVQEVDNSETN
jgi:exonuclease SbcD